MAEKKNGKGKVDKAALKKRGWVEIADSKVEGWEEGKVVIGRFVRIKQGQFGPLLIVDDGEAVRTLGCPTILATKMEGLTLNDHVYIECLGKQVTGQGREAWSFEVMTKRAAQESQGQETLPI